MEDLLTDEEFELYLEELRKWGIVVEAFVKSEAGGSSKWHDEN